MHRKFCLRHPCFLSCKNGKELISGKTDDETSCYHFDYRGSTVALTDKNGLNLLNEEFDSSFYYTLNLCGYDCCRYIIGCSGETDCYITENHRLLNFTDKTELLKYTENNNIDIFGKN